MNLLMGMKPKLEEKICAVLRYEFRYRDGEACGWSANYRSSEGRTVEVAYKGSVHATVLDLLGGIRSTCTYVGAPTLKQLSKCTTFVRCTQQFNSVFVK